MDTGKIETVFSGYGYPNAVKFDSKGRLHILYGFKGEVIRVDLSSGTYRVVASTTPGLDNIAFDSHDRLFISSADDGFIAEARPDGTIRKITAEGMIVPGGVTVHPETGRIYIADAAALREFASDFSSEKVYRNEMGLAAITGPMTVSAAGKYLVLSSWLENKIQVWDPVSRRVVTECGSSLPTNAIMMGDDIIAAELGTASVVRISMKDHSRRTALATGIAVPMGLAATNKDLWISEWVTGNILQIIRDGEELSTPLICARGLSNPEGLALTPDGDLLVVEAGKGRLLRISRVDGTIATLAKDLQLGIKDGIDAPRFLFNKHLWQRVLPLILKLAPGFPPAFIFNGVAVDPSGIIYVTGDKANVLYKVQ